MTLCNFLHTVIEVSFIEKVVFEQRLEGGRSVSVWLSGGECSGQRE